MLWVALDIALVVLGVGLLAFVSLALWRQVRAFLRAAGAAAGQLSAVAAQLEQVGQQGPTSPARHLDDTEAPPRSPLAA